MAGRYETYASRVIIKPYWAGDAAAESFWGVVGAQLDDQLDRLAQARATAWPLTPPVPGASLDPADPDYFPPYSTPADALQYLADERGLERVPGEAELQWRQRLQGAWQIWRESGSQDGHRREFGWSGLLNVRVVRRREWSTPPEAGSVYVRAFARLVWSQFDVYVGLPHQWTQTLWGTGNWGGAGRYWGSNMTPAQLDFFRRQVRDHRSGHDTCTYLYLSFVQGRVWGLSLWGDGGLWGGVGTVVPYVVGEAHWSRRSLL